MKRRARRLVRRGARGRRRRVPGRAARRRAPALHPLLVGLDGQAEGHPAHHGRLPDARRVDPQVRLRPQARGGRVLVLGRRRLGHRPLLHRLRAADERRDVGDVRGRAGLPGQGHLVGAVRALRRDDLLHRADGDPRLHEVGRGVPRASHDLSKLRLLGTVGEPINPKAWLWYWKVIGGERCPVVDTWWQTETGGIMITTLPGAQYDEARLGGHSRCPASTPRSSTRRATRSTDEQGLLVAAPAVAGDAAHALQGRRPLHRDLLREVRQGDLLRRRRGAPGRRRLLLGHRPRRRRDQRLRPPPVDGRGRVGDRLAPEGRRGGGDRRRPTRTPASRSSRS